MNSLRPRPSRLLALLEKPEVVCLLESETLDDEPHSGSEAGRMCDHLLWGTGTTTVWAVLFQLNQTGDRYTALEPGRGAPGDRTRLRIRSMGQRAKGKGTAMAAEQHLGAVFDDRAAAEAAVDDLRQLGLADEHLGVAVHHSETYALEEDVDADVAHGLKRGIAIGAPIGAVAGMTILALAVPGVGTLGVGGILAAGGITGALAGGFWGAYLGLTAEEHVLEEEWDWERVPLRPGGVLIVVAGHGHPEQVADVLQRHGGQLVAKPPHVG